jgi:hypothetical protein
MIHVARTVPRRAVVKQVQLWCVLIDSKRFTGRIRGTQTTLSSQLQRAAQPMLSFSVTIRFIVIPLKVRLSLCAS